MTQAKYIYICTLSIYKRPFAKVLLLHSLSDILLTGLFIGCLIKIPKTNTQKPNSHWAPKNTKTSLEFCSVPSMKARYCVWFCLHEGQTFQKMECLLLLAFCFFLKHVLFYFMFSPPWYPPQGKKQNPKKGKEPHYACFHGSFVFFQTPAFIFYVSSSIILTK